MGWWKNLNSRIHGLEQEEARSFKSHGGKWWHVWLRCVLGFVAIWLVKAPSGYPQDPVFYTGMTIALLACSGVAAYYLKQLYK